MFMPIMQEGNNPGFKMMSSKNRGGVSVCTKTIYNPSIFNYSNCMNLAQEVQEGSWFKPRLGPFCEDFACFQTFSRFKLPIGVNVSTDELPTSAGIDSSNPTTLLKKAVMENGWMDNDSCILFIYTVWHLVVFVLWMLPKDWSWKLASWLILAHLQKCSLTSIVLEMKHP